MYPLEPTEEMIDIRDIAWGLSNKCRFNGQSKHFYSVAEHSIILSRSLPPRYRLWGLMHDAAEAYLPDVTYPIKSHLSNFQQIEENMLKVIASKFNLSWPIPEEVMKKDYILGVNEYMNLIAMPDEAISVMEVERMEFINKWRNVCYSEMLEENFTINEAFLAEYFLNSIHEKLSL